MDCDLIREHTSAINKLNIVGHDSNIREKWRVALNVSSKVSRNKSAHHGVFFWVWTALVCYLSLHLQENPVVESHRMRYTKRDAVVICSQHVALISPSSFSSEPPTAFLAYTWSSKCAWTITIEVPCTLKGSSTFSATRLLRGCYLVLCNWWDFPNC